MAQPQAIAAAAQSVERFLSFCFEDEEPVPGRATRAVLARTEDLRTDENAGVIIPPALSLFLYRVDVNRTMRAPWSAVGSQSGRAHLPLDLHFLLTPWADNATHEHLILGRTLQCLETTPILAGPLLDPTAGWQPHEAVQIIHENLTTEDLMRTFDSLPVDYKLSAPYVVRVVRVDGPGVVAADATEAIGRAAPRLEP